MKLRFALFTLTIVSILVLPSCVKRHFVEISCDQFANNSQYTSEMNIDVGDMVTVTLCSNPTTGFTWSEEISNESVINQVEYEFLPPEGDNGEPPPGAAGKDKWVYAAMIEGTSTILFEYSQPWPEGIKREWIYELTLVVGSGSD